MHDPMTVAFEIRYPWRKYGADAPNDFLREYRAPFITIWHVDPEKRGDDDSCDWFGRHRPLNPRERAIVDAMWGLETYLDNRPHYPDSPEHREFQTLKAAVYAWRRRSGWRIPVRWHVWHWQVQIHPVQAFKRWAFSRCCWCGGRFSWEEQVVGYSWHGTGPRWFRNEHRIAHMACDSQHVAAQKATAVHA